MQIVKAALVVLSRLTDAGYEAFAVGGCVRDWLRGVVPHDWDITTNALPSQMMEALEGLRVIPTGLQHGTLTVVVGDTPIEVTTYRVDGEYTDHRHPDKVCFTHSLEEDLARRDFTVNAMAYHLVKGLIDPFGGKADLDAGIIRCVGDPHRRFEEDALRIMRGLRFASTLSFAIEERTAEALRQKAHLLQAVAAERIYHEFKSLLLGDGVRDVLLTYPDVLGVVIPEITDMKGCKQHHPCHIADVYTHSVLALAAAPSDFLLRMTMLLHDCGKPHCRTTDEQGVDHFYGHAALSASIAHRRLIALKAERSTVDRVTRFITHHDVMFPSTRPIVRRWLNRLGEEDFRMLLAVKRADTAGQAPSLWKKRNAELARFDRLLEEIVAEKSCFSLSQLAVNGQDVLSLGVTGREIGRLLNRILTEVMEERLPNQRDILLQWMQENKDRPSE